MIMIIIYSETPLNGYPSMADSCNIIMDVSECPDHISIDFSTLKPLNSGHPAIPYNRH